MFLVVVVFVFVVVAVVVLFLLLYLLFLCLVISSFFLTILLAYINDPINLFFFTNFLLRCTITVVYCYFVKYRSIF